MARLHDFVFDAARPSAVARFWAAALDGYAVAPYDEAELARLRALGFEGPEDDPTVLVEPEGGGGPRLWFQRVEEPAVGKNRVHPDVLAADVEAEAERLTGLGARVLTRHEDHLVLADPEDNEFCLYPERDGQG
ncbi:VOC family protein [Streptomyces sedi]|uniref:VOC family protein n=1 Tax=Streptomyces sedi TaxID=555059 RepID=A0A5C4UTI1_9ACTN|nr:VOC family protein [Streptomyces sedi]TNM27020.1 VOC family protein [Streptomyces sedi]